MFKSYIFTSYQILPVFVRWSKTRWKMIINMTEVRQSLWLENNIYSDTLELLKQMERHSENYELTFKEYFLYRIHNPRLWRTWMERRSWKELTSKGTTYQGALRSSCSHTSSRAAAMIFLREGETKIASILLSSLFSHCFPTISDEENHSHELILSLRENPCCPAAI